MPLRPPVSPQDGESGGEEGESGGEEGESGDEEGESGDEEGESGGKTPARLTPVIPGSSFCATRGQSILGVGPGATRMGVKFGGGGLRDRARTPRREGSKLTHWGPFTPNGVLTAPCCIVYT